MSINSKHRLSIERYNAPFRGASSRSDFVNFYLSVTHDLKYIQNQLGYSDNYFGMKQKEKTNFEMLFIGEGSQATASISSAGKYINAAEEVLLEKDLTLWNPNNDIVVSKKLNKFNLKSNGLKDPAFISINLKVQPNEIFMVRFKIKKIKGKCDSVYIGAHSINGTGEDLKNVNMSLTSTSIYVDKRLYCTQREEVSLRIYLHKIPEKLELTEVEISDFSINYIHEKDISIGSIEYDIKPSLDSLENNIIYIKKG